MFILNNLCKTLEEYKGEEYLFLGGDFNCAVSSLDRNHIEPHMPSRRRLIQMIETHDLVDVWRNFNKDLRQYTWVHARDNSLSLARLDKLYVFKHHLSIFKRCFISPVGFSDHCLIGYVSSMNSVKPSSAYWHFNTTLLNDTRFKEILNCFWINLKKEKNHF